MELVLESAAAANSSSYRLLVCTTQQLQVIKAQPKNMIHSNGHLCNLQPLFELLAYLCCMMGSLCHAAFPCGCQLAGHTNCGSIGLPALASCDTAAAAAAKEAISLASSP
jgi:hypothetical protein